MSLASRDIAALLSELDQLLLHEARSARWERDSAAERVALSAARRLLSQLDDDLTTRMSELSA